MEIEGFVTRVENIEMPRKGFFPELSSVRINLESRSKIWKLKLGVIESRLIPKLVGQHRFKIKNVKTGYTEATWIVDACDEEVSQAAKRQKM